MKRLLIAIVAVLATGMSAGVADTLINLEEAAEVFNLEIRLNGTSASRIYARICDNCELLTLSVDNKTRIKRGSTRLSLAQAADLKNKGATVLFDPSTLRVTRIIYWN